MNCPECGNPIIKNIHKKKYCSRACMERAAKRRYKKTLNGKIARHNYETNKRASEVGIAKIKIKKARHYQIHKSEIIKRISAYKRTDKGKQLNRASTARRRLRSNNSLLFKIRTNQMQDLREPCALCGIEYNSLFTIDHILAICNGGKDEESNYQPICLDCHKKKNGRDIKVFWDSRKR